MINLSLFNREGLMIDWFNESEILEYFLLLVRTLLHHCCATYLLCDFYKSHSKGVAQQWCNKVFCIRSLIKANTHIFSQGQLSDEIFYPLSQLQSVQSEVQCTSGL